MLPALLLLPLLLPPPAALASLLTPLPRLLGFLLLLDQRLAWKGYKCSRYLRAAHGMPGWWQGSVDCAAGAARCWRSLARGSTDLEAFLCHPALHVRRLPSHQKGGGQGATRACNAPLVPAAPRRASAVRGGPGKALHWQPPIVQLCPCCTLSRGPASLDNHLSCSNLRSTPTPPSRTAMPSMPTGTLKGRWMPMKRPGCPCPRLSWGSLPTVRGWRLGEGGRWLASGACLFGLKASKQTSLHQGQVGASPAPTAHMCGCKL